MREDSGPQEFRLEAAEKANRLRAVFNEQTEDEQRRRLREIQSLNRVCDRQPFVMRSGRRYYIWQD